MKKSKTGESMRTAKNRVRRMVAREGFVKYVVSSKAKPGKESKRIEGQRRAVQAAEKRKGKV